MTTTTTEKTIEKPKPKESKKTIEKPKKIKSEEKLQVEENKDEQIAPKPAEKETTSETLKETQQSKTDNDAPIAPAEDEKQSVKHESPKQETKDSKQENDLESLLKERLKELKKKRNELDEISIEIKKISEHQDEKTEADNEKTDKNKGYILSDEDLFNFPEKKSHTQKSTKTKTAFTIESLENNKKTNAKNQKQEIIDKFITERSKSKPSFSKTKKTIDFDIPKFHETSELVTETLAKIYTSQGHLDKALTTYEKLSLKYPQKNIYFANQIEKIKELIRTKEK
ncbi:MAG: hypothetical protein U9N51_03240 [Bacteroidota bacterium]|nr:hypothetical protein [Bacteroidota bacterium]